MTFNASDGAEPNPPTGRWLVATRSAEVTAALETDRHGLIGLWTPLRSAASESTDPDVRTLLDLLGRVASMFVRPDDLNNPYGPAIAIDGQRSTIHSDFEPEEIEILRECVGGIPHPLLRSRVYDVLALLTPWPARATLSLASIDALLEEPISSESWNQEHAAWERAVALAVRLRQPARARVQRLEQTIRAAIRISGDGFLALRAASLLKSNGLAHDRAKLIAEKLARIANNERANANRARAYRAGAAEWYLWAGDAPSAHQQMILEVQSFMDEGEASAALGEMMRAASSFEQALRALRRIPRRARDEMGVSTLSAQIARRIRETGAAGLGSMHAFTSESMDLSGVVTESRDRVKGLSVLDAMLALAMISPLANVEREQQQAEQLITEHPLQSIFTTVTYSSDGRIVHRSGGQGGTPIYGVDPATWRQMCQSYGFRLSLVTTAQIYPAYVQISNEHHLGIEEFIAMTAGGGIVPLDRTRQFAAALYYGYNGDFSTAAQLLSPQIENLVRHHLANAGISTTNITPDGLEQEVGLTNLMEREGVEDVLGTNLAFEIRALFCTPLGPNLRNEVAHGLLSDAAANSGHSLYAWWLALRLVLTPYWNERHDTEAAEAREPQRPEERDAEDE